MTLASEMKDRVELQRYVEGPEGVGHHYEPVDHIWAAASSLGAGRFTFRIRFRPDLRERDDLEPAMRVRYRGVDLAVDDVTESIRGVEVTIFAHRDIIEPIDHLQTGTRRIKSWP